MADHRPEIDQVTGVETTGHEWDGLKELNNPAPRWWLWVWMLTIIWSVGYWVVYPAWPSISGHTKGSWGWTQYAELAESQKEIVARQSSYIARLDSASLDQIKHDPDLYNFAVAAGGAAFKENCAACHGAGAQGGVGYPNLSDDDWLWGGTVEDIYQTIQYGIRSSHVETRMSQMPAFGKDGILTAEQVNDVADYVLALSGSERKAGYDAGAQIFQENCAACHGEQGKGGREFGAPNLTDAIWLYGNTHDAVYNTVFNAHAGVMPTWEGRLDKNTIRELAIYVHSLGGGETSPAVATAPSMTEATPAP